MESGFLSDAPQAFHLADGMYHFISRDPHIQLKNDSDAANCFISTLSYQTILVRPSCKSELSINRGDQEFVPDLGFCKNK